MQQKDPLANFINELKKATYNDIVTEVMGNYSAFPKYLQEPKLLENIKWNEYRFLLRCHSLTLGNKKLQGIMKEKHLHEIGLTSWTTIKRAMYGTQDSDTDGLTRRNLITEETHSVDMSINPIFHLRLIKDTPKAWEVTFLFPDQRRVFGGKRKPRNYFVKLWYLGNGKDGDGRDYKRGEKQAPRRLSVIHGKFPETFWDGGRLYDISVNKLTGFKIIPGGFERPVYFIPKKYTREYQKNQTGEMWIGWPAANRLNHFYFFVINLVKP